MIFPSETVAVNLLRFLGKGGKQGGMFTYGGLDTAHCGKVIAYEPLTSPTYWQFKVTLSSSLEPPQMKVSGSGGFTIAAECDVFGIRVDF